MFWLPFTPTSTKKMLLDVYEGCSITSGANDLLEDGVLQTLPMYHYHNHHLMRFITVHETRDTRCTCMKTCL